MLSIFLIGHGISLYYSLTELLIKIDLIDRGFSRPIKKCCSLLLTRSLVLYNSSKISNACMYIIYSHFVIFTSKDGIKKEVLSLFL